MDTSKFVSARDPEVWSSMKYRPIVSGDYKIVQENPDFKVVGPVIPTDRILYTVYTDDLSDDFNGLRSWWIDENSDIESNTYDKNTGKGELILKEGVTEISGYDDDGWRNAFDECGASIESIVLPTQITSIGAAAFYYIDSLTSIVIPDSVEIVGEYAFEGCSGLVEPVYNANCFVYFPCGYATEYTIQDGIRQICGSAFRNCDDLTSITIPDSVTSIGEYAFSGCSGLTSITIPDSVTEIDNNAFEYCTKSTSITIPDSVTSIGEYAFNAVKNIIYHGIAATGSPWGANTINGFIEGNLIYSDETKQVLTGCDVSATSVVIPNSVTEISYRAFLGCSELESIAIPDSVTKIGYESFSGCSGLTSIIIPNSVISIGEYAFSSCSGLIEVTIPDSITFINTYAFYGCSSLTSVTIPNSVISIYNCAFENCRSLTSITLPDSVTYIDFNAFYNCSGLISVTLGNSVTNIRNNAFYGCINLASVTCKTITPPTLEYGNFGRSSDTLYVPAESVNAYKSTNWNNAFSGNIQAIN